MIHMRMTEALFALVGRFGWETLATRYVEQCPSAEVHLFRSAGGVLSGIAHLADQSAEGIARSGGALALFSFESGRDGRGT